MKAPENPRRLLEQSRYRAYLEPFDQVPEQNERLARIRQEFEATIREGASERVTVLGSARAPSFRRTLKLALVASLLLSAVAGAVYLLSSRSAPAEKPPAPRQLRPRPLPVPTLVPETDLPPLPESNEPAEPPRRNKRSSKPSSPAPRAVAKLTPTPVPAETVLAPKSALPEQIRLFRQARHAGEQGDFEDAFAHLVELDRRFPHGSLAAEAKLLRVRLLYRAERYPVVVAEIETLLDQAELAGKKAQLLRVAGDAYAHLGRCEQARAAFRLALGLGLDEKEAEAARAGLRACTGP